MASILPSVRAKLKERFVFNFQFEPEALQRYLPVDWLRPDPVEGPDGKVHAIASFCILDLANITIAPLPTVIGLPSMSCAPRYAVLDQSQDAPEPAVYVANRYTSSAFGSWFTGLGFSAPHPYAKAALEYGPNSANISIQTTKNEIADSSAGEQTNLFTAEIRPAEGDPSALFTPDSFAAFIKKGVKSYGPSRHEGAGGNRLTKLDLIKEDATYQPLELLGMSGAIVDDWQAAGGTFDSAYRTTGGTYEWRYYGLTD